MPMMGILSPSRFTSALKRRKYLLEGEVAGRAEEHEGVGFQRAHGPALRSRRNCSSSSSSSSTSATPGGVDAEIALETQRDARAAQPPSRESPFGLVDRDHAHVPSTPSTPSSTSSTMCRSSTANMRHRSSTLSSDPSRGCRRTETALRVTAWLHSEACAGIERHGLRERAVSGLGLVVGWRAAGRSAARRKSRPAARRACRGPCSRNFAAGLRARRNLQIDDAARRRRLHGRAERGFPGRHGQIEDTDRGPRRDTAGGAGIRPRCKDRRAWPVGPRGGGAPWPARRMVCPGRMPFGTRTLSTRSRVAMRPSASISGTRSVKLLDPPSSDASRSSSTLAWWSSPRPGSMPRRPAPPRARRAEQGLEEIAVVARSDPSRRRRR